MSELWYVVHNLLGVCTCSDCQAERRAKQAENALHGTKEEAKELTLNQEKFSQEEQ